MKKRDPELAKGWGQIVTPLAELYMVETKNLKRAVRANIERFPPDFMFELTKEEYDALRCNFFTLKAGRGQHSKYLPFAFTREGIAMLSGLLRSELPFRPTSALCVLPP